MQDHRAPAQAQVLSIIASSQTLPRMAELAGRSVSRPRPLTPQVDAMQQAELVGHRIDPHNRHSRCRISPITASS